MQDFTAIDVETTGLNPKTEKIIEVGAVKVRNGKIVERFDSLVHPGRRNPSGLPSDIATNSASSGINRSGK